MLGYTGGFKKRWISTIANSPEVTKIIDDRGDQFRTLMEMKLQSRQPLEGWRRHLGSARLRGRWGVTRVFWPITDEAMKAQMDVKSIADRLNLSRKGGGNG